MNNTWTLFDPTKNTKSEKLSTEEAQFVILRLKTKALDDYLIMRDDWSQWKKLNIFLDSPESPFMNLVPLSHEKTETVKTPIKPKKISPSFDFSDVRAEEVDLETVFGSHAKQFTVDSIDQNHKSSESDVDFKKMNSYTAFTPKRSPEDAFKIEILLIHPNGEMFRTMAKDISLTGTFCEKIVPAAFHNSVFDMVIINNVISEDDYKRLNLKGKVLITDSRTYIKYHAITAEQKNSLRAGLDYYVRVMKTLQQKN